MIVTGPYETKKLQRDSTFMWGVTLYEPGVSSKTNTFPTREEALSFAIRTLWRDHSTSEIVAMGYELADVMRYVNDINPEEAPHG